jgi:Na+/H+-dicarboxylate symporter
VGLVFVKAFNLPIEIAALIGGIYHILDMGNTTLNVMNDMVATVIVARLEGAIQVENGAIIPAATPVVEPATLGLHGKNEKTPAETPVV